MIPITPTLRYSNTPSPSPAAAVRPAKEVEDPGEAPVTVDGGCGPGREAGYSSVPAASDEGMGGALTVGFRAVFTADAG